MGILQHDLEEQISTKADEMAEQRYGMEFSDLSDTLKMQVWGEAQQEVRSSISCVEESICNREKAEFWGDLNREESRFSATEEKGVRFNELVEDCQTKIQVPSEVS